MAETVTDIVVQLGSKTVGKATRGEYKAAKTLTVEAMRWSNDIPLQNLVNHDFLVTGKKSGTFRNDMKVITATKGGHFVKFKSVH